MKLYWLIGFERFRDSIEGLLVAVGLILFVLSAGGMYSGLYWLAAVLFCLAASSSISIRSQAKTIESLWSKHTRTLLILWAVVTIYFVGRYLFCQWVGDFQMRLKVGAHWLGPPVSAAAFLSSWSVWTFGILAFYVSSRLSRHSVFVLGWVFLSLVLFEVIYGFIAFLAQSDTIFNLHPRDGTRDISGTFVNRNLFSAFMAMATPISVTTLYIGGRFSPIVKLFCVMLLLVMATIAVVESHSRLGFVAFLSGTVFVLWFIAKCEEYSLKKRFVLTLGLVLSMVVFFLLIGGEVLLRRFLQLPNAVARLKIWSSVLDVPATYWFLGIGPGNTELVLRQLFPLDFDPVSAHVHSEPVQFVLEFGVVFAVLISIVTILRFRNVFRLQPNLMRYAALSGLLAGIVSACGDYPFRMPALSITCCLLLGIVANERITSGGSFHRLTGQNIQN